MYTPRFAPLSHPDLHAVVCRPLQKDDLRGTNSIGRPAMPTAGWQLFQLLDSLHDGRSDDLLLVALSLELAATSCGEKRTNRHGCSDGQRHVQRVGR